MQQRNFRLQVLGRYYLRVTMINYNFVLQFHCNSVSEDILYGGIKVHFTANINFVSINNYIILLFYLRHQTSDKQLLKCHRYIVDIPRTRTKHFHFYCANSLCFKSVFNLRVICIYLSGALNC